MSDVKRDYRWFLLMINTELDGTNYTYGKPVLVDDVVFTKAIQERVITVKDLARYVHGDISNLEHPAIEEIALEAYLREGHAQYVRVLSDALDVKNDITIEGFYITAGNSVVSQTIFNTLLLGVQDAEYIVRHRDER